MNDSAAEGDYPLQLLTSATELVWKEMPSVCTFFPSTPVQSG